MLRSFTLQAIAGLLVLLVQEAAADCQSYGVDFVNGGSYCINTNLNDYFSFGTQFTGCTVNDTQGDVIPIVVDPNNDNYYCSGIPTQPDYVDQISTCDVAGYELRKSQMISGAWIIVIEGLTFAWMRTFNINAAPPVTVTQTPTATFTVTSTPTFTGTSTLTNIIPSTLPPATLTLPSTTITSTRTVTPPLSISISTDYLVITLTTRVYSATTTTLTQTRPCGVASTRRDVLATIRPALAQAAAALVTPAPLAVRRNSRDWNNHYRREAERLGMLEFEKRDPDSCSTTVLDPSDVISSYTTITAVPTTILSTIAVNSTQLITPPPVTAFSGRARTTITTTAPTPIITLTVPGITTSWLTRTVLATVTQTLRAAPTTCDAVNNDL